MDEEISSAVSYALNKGFQIHPDALEILHKIDVKELAQIIKDVVKEKTKQKQFLINEEDFEIYLGIKDDEEHQVEFEILSDPTSKITSAEGVEGYGKLFASRFNKLKQIMSDRPESKKVKDIESVKSITKNDDELFVWGLVSDRKSDRNITKITLEDPTSSMEIVVFEGDLKDAADTLLMDQFAMFKIVPAKNGGFFAKEIFLPDIPEHTTNRSKTETYAVFLSDLHVGSKFFMEEELSEFIKWISSADPIARKIRFVVVGGDLIDGVGVFPGQEKILNQTTTEGQLQKTFEVLDKIPKHIKVFLISGNHDAGRKALPQPAIPKMYNSQLWDRENFFMLGNPSMISLNGVKVLMYHGQSIDDVVRTTPGVSYDKPAAVMRHFLRARHMSPIYGSRTPIAPETEDMMVIDDIPDIFHSGHVHFVGLDMYKGVLIVNSGAWQRQTDFQESVGITPTPGMAIIVNLQTMKVYQKDFRVQESDFIEPKHAEPAPLS
ncbi:MAG: DNA-directed DNA polymerase II small subunit [Thaumarchaeota archaeon]|nr:DNA-directed DNA polymerase II small subunit [Nitrososphaerota archaeon]MBT4509511.1 DNA-directed DNA polymerase II small subunit [Nitrososphaerota archaeon]MBT4675361.1 DNA-directed DNA polymerase II small subunit [Nitrososphaerota archaeon]MBT4973523.1 DNA-directed DNA polymerase II small subunit [Nitrososphaerota archaeon]MBT5238040.1 DNA-directed DNA polymerase II small subunit [Nitrososphaerota archaeon]